jgi:hypothetical protein
MHVLESSKEEEAGCGSHQLAHRTREHACIHLFTKSHHKRKKMGEKQRFVTSHQKREPFWSTHLSSASSSQHPIQYAFFYCAGGWLAARMVRRLCLHIKNHVICGNSASSSMVNVPRVAGGNLDFSAELGYLQQCCFRAICQFELGLVGFCGLLCERTCM